MEKSTRIRLIEARKHHKWSQQDVADQLATTQNNVSRWERGLTTPGPYFNAKLCKLFGLSAQELGLLPVKTTQIDLSIHTQETLEDEFGPKEGISSPSYFWYVPYPRNPHFTGREKLLDQLDQYLAPGRQSDPMTTRQAALTQAQAIKGLGGIGKTQIAVEYAYRAHERGRYTQTLWINAASEEAVLTSFTALAKLLPAFPAPEETDQRKLAAALKHWLEDCQHSWLLIVDNVDDLSLVQEYLPRRGNGSLLLTTRAHAVGSLAAVLDVETMGLVEGTIFLLHRALRQQISEEERNEAANIVIALDGFPLALDQAGAYIEETGCSFGDYLRIYQEHRHLLLARRGRQTTNYPDSVATTWSLSFHQVAQTNPAAAELLRMCAFFAPDHIPEELLTAGAPHWSPVLQQAVGDLFTFNQMLEALLAFSLVKRLAEDHLLSIHRLVQVVQRDALPPEMQRQYAERVVRAVNTVFPRKPQEEVTSWPQCLRYLEQVQACDLLIQQQALLLPEAVDLLDRTATYLLERGMYPLARSLYLRAIQLGERLRESEPLLAVSPLSNLATLTRRQGRYAEAEPLFQQALQIQEHHLGPTHLDLASPLNRLGNLYAEQGKYREAEVLYQRSLQIWEQHVGREHVLTASPLRNLAGIYQEQGRYAEAEPLCQRALRLWEEQLGPDHLQVANALQGLAVLSAKQGKYTEAEPLYQRALQIRERQLGPDHPHVASPLIGLAELSLEQKKYTTAEFLFQRALQIYERQLGPDYPLVAHILTGLANLYKDQGKYSEAELLYQRALALREQTLEPHHPHLAETLVGLAALREAEEKLQEAVSLYQRALAIYVHVFGPQHFKTATAREQLHTTLLALGRTKGRKEAEGEE